MATTTNFGWVTPDNTDLVKDGASAIRTLGSSIDSSMGDLKGGTTGQVLSKTTGTDMDFTWVTTDDTNAIQNAIVDAKGDLIAATAADTPARLAVGTDGQVLVADSTAATGLKWTGAGKVLQVVAAYSTTSTTNSTNTYADTTLTATITPSAATSKILVLVSQNGLHKSAANNASSINVRLLRTATTLSTFAIFNLYTNTAIQLIGSASVSHLDSPSTTSATTYKTQFMNPQNVAAVGVQLNNDQSSIILMEIGA